MTHPTSPSLLPTIPHPEIFSDQGNSPLAAAGSSCSAQRKEEGIPLLHANTRHTATQIEAKFRRRQRDEEPHAPTNLERLPVELLAKVVKRLPEHGPCLTSIARVTRLLHINTVSLANKKVTGAVELERSLLLELKKNANHVWAVHGHRGEVGTRPGEERLDFVRDNLRRAREGLTQADYLQVLYTHVRFLDNLGEWLVMPSPYAVDAFELLRGGIDIFIGELQTIEPKKTVQEKSFPEAAIKAKLAIAEKLVLHITRLWIGGRNGTAITISQREELSVCAKAVINEMSRLAAYQESEHEGNTETGLKTGCKILQTQIAALTEAFRNLLQNMWTLPCQEAVSAYSKLRGMQWAAPFQDVLSDHNVSDWHTFKAIENYVRPTPLHEVNFEKLSEIINDFENSEIKKACANPVLELKQLLMDKHMYDDTLGSIVVFLKKVFPDDESKMNCIKAMTRNRGSEDEQLRQISMHARNIIERMIDALEDSQLKDEAGALLNGKIAQ